MSDTINPFAELKRAARGDLEAMRNLANQSIANWSVDPCPFGAVEGLVFARLAAAHGEQEDAGRLLSMMGLASHSLKGVDEDWRSSLHSEAVAFVAKLADDGVDMADWCLSEIVGESTPEEVAWSKDIHRAMSEA